MAEQHPPRRPTRSPGGRDLPVPPEEQEKKRDLFRTAGLLMILAQIPAVATLSVALQKLCELLPQTRPITWLEALGLLLPFLLWWNVGMFIYLSAALPERPLSRPVLYGLILPFFCWFVTTALLLPAGPLLLLSGWLLELLLPSHLLVPWLQHVVLGVGVGALCMGFYAVHVRRHWVQVTTLPIEIPGLPASFDGYRIVQLSDLHIGNFARLKTLEKWVRLAHAQKPDLIVLTGDLLASGDDFIPTLTAGLQQLHAPDGVAYCPGNHDYWSSAVLFPALERAGVQVLRNAGRYLVRRDELIYLAGVDDTWTRQHDLKAALAARFEPVPTVLLAHDPALFPQATRQGIALTLSGHTHGGQWAIPFVPAWNLSARVFPYTVGLYQQAGSKLYVNRGLGTTGPPARIGAAPELSVFVLRPAPALPAPERPPREKVGSTTSTT